MNWLKTAALVIHVLLALGIIGLVLLQRGKGAEAGAGFGAGASGTVFGARGSASFLSRSTAVMAGLFFITSLLLAYLGGKPTGSGSGSVMETPPTTQVETPVTSPATSEAQPRQPEVPVENKQAAPSADVPVGTPPK